MSYEIAKLVSEYVSPGVFINRLELGDSGLNGPVDLRFIGDPGWIENAHSVFFDVNGRDAYYPTNTGGLISTSDTGDLVFFDPSNTVGRTLSQLYAGAGGAYLPLAGGQMALNAIIDMHDGYITNVDKILAADGGEGYDELLIQSQSGLFDIAKFQSAAGDTAGGLDMLGNHVFGLSAADSNGHAVRYEQLADYLPLAGGTMAASATINMSGGKLDNLDRVDSYSTSGIDIYNAVGTRSGILGLSNYALQCDLFGINMNDNAITAVGGITMHDATSPIDMAGSAIDNLNRIDAYFGGCGIYDSNDAHVLTVASLASAFILYRRIDMSAEDIINIGDITMGATSVLSVSGGEITNVKFLEFDEKTSDPTTAEGAIFYKNNHFYGITSAGAVQLDN